MASPADSPEIPQTLPRPELNPLLNPLLGDNMGRWAEVYFTSAPEKREEAVIELLRELEAQKGRAAAAPTKLSATAAMRMETRSALPEDTIPQSNLSNLLPCDTCGHANPVTHQFCGMCGAPVGAGNIAQAKANEGHSLGDLEREKAPAYQEFSDDYREPIEEQSRQSEDEVRPDLYDLSLFQSLRERDDPGDLEYDDSPSVRYRYYIAAVVAILILVLGYTAWKASRTDGGSQQAQLAAAPAATDVPAPASATNQRPADSASEVPANAATQPANSSANNAGAKAPPKPAEPPKQPQAAKTERPTPPESQPPTADSLASQNAGNGAEELAMAQHFLSGNNGQGRDAAEGAKWLWKSIAKHNGPAVLVLADLYLKGEGVTKSCDQARVLLDSAARRGTAGAGEKIRNLRAFGCQ